MQRVPVIGRVFRDLKFGFLFNAFIDALMFKRVSDYNCFGRSGV